MWPKRPEPDRGSDSIEGLSDPSEGDDYLEIMQANLANLSRAVLSMTGALVELRAAAIGYDDHEVLRDIDFTLSQGEFVAVVGPNGSWKSTLVKALVGLTPLTSGSLELFGLPAERFAYKVADRLRSPTPHRGRVPATVREVVASGRLARGGLLHRGRPADRAAVDNAMERVGVAELASRPVD